MWHPGKLDQSQNLCAMYGLNLYFGGPLFQTPQEFIQVYAAVNSKGLKETMTEISSKGINIMGMKHMVYNEATREWYTPHCSNVADFKSRWGY